MNDARAITGSLVDRLMRLSIPVPHCGCWLWLGITDSHGYGHLKTDGRPVGAHRVSWMVHRGEIPLGKCVLHRCDIRSCINPDHLFLGTNADNMHDMIKKGRHKPPATTTLSPADVINIRRSPMGCRRLAAIYRVGTTCIKHIRRRKTWKNI